LLPKFRFFEPQQKTKILFSFFLRDKKIFEVFLLFQFLAITGRAQLRSKSGLFSLVPKIFLRPSIGIWQESSL
jgi:hypothetical protein